jgi:hypothetical protein
VFKLVFQVGCYRSNRHESVLLTSQNCEQKYSQNEISPYISGYCSSAVRSTCGLTLEGRMASSADGTCKESARCIGIGPHLFIILWNGGQPFARRIISRTVDASALCSCTVCASSSIRGRNSFCRPPRGHDCDACSISRVSQSTELEKEPERNGRGTCKGGLQTAGTESWPIPRMRTSWSRIP